MYLKLVFGKKIWLRKDLLYIHGIYEENMKFAFQKVCVPKIGFSAKNLAPQEFTLLTPNSWENFGAGMSNVIFFRRKPKHSFFGKFSQELYAERAPGTRGAERAAPRAAPHHC